MKKAIKVWDYTDYKQAEKEKLPITWTDVASERKGCEVTIMTLKEAREDDKKAQSSIYKDEDGCWAMIIKADCIKEKDLQKYMDILTLFSGVKYRMVSSPMHKKKGGKNERHDQTHKG